MFWLCEWSSRFFYFLSLSQIECQIGWTQEDLALFKPLGDSPFRNLFYELVYFISLLLFVGLDSLTHFSKQKVLILLEVPENSEIVAVGNHLTKTLGWLLYTVEAIVKSGYDLD